MTFLFMLLGAVLTPLVCAGMFEEETGWTAAVLGAMVGLLLGQLRTVRARVTKLEQALARAGEDIAVAAPPVPLAEPARPAAPPPTPAAAIPEMPPAAAPTPAIATIPPAPPTAAAAPAMASTQATAATPIPAPLSTTPPLQDTPLMRAIKRWFTEGNVPVKVGVLVLFLG